jgi:transposase
MKTKYFIGLDVHKETTAYAVRDRKGNVLLEGETATLYPDLHERLRPYLVSSKIGLEASTSYYTLYREFQENKYDVMVANTVQMRQLISKDDILDARRLAEMLRLGNFPTAYIPGDKIQRMRSLVQLRHSLMEERTRCNSRIQAFLDRNGVVMPSQKAFGKKWTHTLMQHMGSGKVSQELRYAYEHYAFLDHRIEQLDQEMVGYALKYWRNEYDLIKSIVGFGPTLTCYIIAEVFPLHRFSSKRKLRRYAGVIPVYKKTGKTTSKGKIPKSSSRKLLRWSLVQAANTIAKTNTKLGKYYRKKKKQKKNTGIAKLAVASTLVDILYNVLTTKEPYIAS